MKNNIIVLATLTLLSLNVYAVDKLSWGLVAKIDVKIIEQMAREYLSKNAPELKGIKIKLLEVSAGYRDNKNKLFASFYHDKSYIKGSEEKIEVTTVTGKQYRELATFDIVVVSFNEIGKPFKKSIFGEKFLGSQKDFEKHFNK